MLSRRQLMLGTALGALAFGPGARRAMALTSEPMPAPVAAAYALACKSPAAAGGDHADLIAGAQAALKQEIARGTAKAGTVEMVTCPICGCRFSVTADAVL
jgi:hypothetical protein